MKTERIVMLMELVAMVKIILVGRMSVSAVSVVV